MMGVGYWVSKDESLPTAYPDAEMLIWPCVYVTDNHEDFICCKSKLKAGNTQQAEEEEQQVHVSRGTMFQLCNFYIHFSTQVCH